jgi:hypothetical protein
MTDSEYPFDMIDGREVPPKVVREDETLRGTHQGGVYVEREATLVLLGTHQGSLHLEAGARSVIVGQHQGSLHVADDAVATIRGSQQGSTHVAEGGEVVVESSGRLAGSLHNEGAIHNGGVRGGTASGSGILEDLPGSTVKQPQIRNGMTVYAW